MRAIAVDQLRGNPHLVELPEPRPAADQLLVKVAVAGINPFDWKLADGMLDGAMPTVLPFVLGLDAAGTVVATGGGVTRFKVGDRVFGQFFHAPLGEGTYAEYAVVPETGAVTTLPMEVSDKAAAALPTAGMTAAAMLETLHLPSNATLLIVGATGGVGSFATQLAVARGLRVLATAGPADTARMRQLGAFETFDPEAGELTAQVKEKHPKGVDAVIDLVSDAAAFAALAGAVRPGGMLLTTLGVADEDALAAQGRKGGNFQLHGAAPLLDWLADEVKSGRLAVPVTEVIDLEEVPAAIARSRAGQARGKTVIRIAS